MDGFYDQQVPYMVTNVSDRFKVGVYKLDSDLFLWGSFAESLCFVTAVGATLHLGALPAPSACLPSYFNKAASSFTESFGMIKRSCT